MNPDWRERLSAGASITAWTAAWLAAVVVAGCRALSSAGAVTYYSDTTR